ncbi:TPA: TetR/AcrR family transcriptional regulator [Pseudomonas aeruginosa]
MDITDSGNNEGDAVRPKASHRKGRTSEVQRTPRIPTQERSRRRYQAIIDATEFLLKSANIEDISLYDIGKAAGITPASVHYLFSTVAAIHIELNRIYNETLTNAIFETHSKLVDLQIGSWQEWTRITLDAARNRLNASRPMCEIMLGPVLHRKSRIANLEGNTTLGRVTLENLKQVFIVPDIPDLEKKFMYAGEIVDALWSGAYSTRGRVDDETFDETMNAVISYLRNVLPETMRLLK